MSKLARFVGKEIVVKWFLERYCSLCQDPMFQVRRVCASSMGEIATVIGTRLTEAVLVIIHNFLEVCLCLPLPVYWRILKALLCLLCFVQLPEFLVLCKDDVWGVRKGCAEVFTEIARLCQLSTRRDKLTPTFVKLLEDSTRWVKVAAYQSLGPFVTTFSVESDSPVEVPELTEFEKTFIERVKESPSMLALEGKDLLHHRTSMMGSASTEDLTSICIQDDDDEDEDEKVKSYEGSEGKEGEPPRRETEDSELTPKKAKHAHSWSWMSKFSKFDRQRQVEPSLSKSELYRTEDFLPENNIELTERGRSSRKYEDNNEDERDANQIVSSTSSTDNAAMSPVVSVHNLESQPGVHIHVEKEACPELAQICRSSSVLSHRPSSISSNIHRGHISSSHGVPTTSMTATTTSVTTTSNISSNSATATPDSTTTTYNTFQYWRIPLPDIELDIGIVEGKPASVHVRAKVEDPTLKLTYASEISVNLSSDTVTRTISEKQEKTTAEDQMKVENLQIQALSSSFISDSATEHTTKLESSLCNTTVSLVDGRVADVQTSCMDMYNVAGNTHKDSQMSGGGGVIEDFALDITHLDGFDEDSDDQLSTCTFSFRDEREYFLKSYLCSRNFMICDMNDLSQFTIVCNS